MYTVNGGGSDIWATADQFQYAYQPLSGDGTIVARVTSQTDTDPWAKAGIMIKQSAIADAPYAMLAVTPGNGINMEYGFNANIAGGSYTFPNAWLKLTRAGNVFTAYDSADGTTWTEVGATTVTMAASATVGLFVTSHNSGQLSSVTFDNVTVTPGGQPLPSPWASTDVGSPAVAGASTYANGVYTVNGSGSDIWATADQFQYAYQPLSGDGTIVARVTSQTDTDPWAKAGIMIKQSAIADAPYAMLAVTPGNGINMEYGFNANIAGGSYTFPNAWLKLTRAGNVFTAYDSADGTTWTEVGATTVTMAASATVGLFVTSHNSGQLSSVTFDNVTVTSTFTTSAAPLSASENVATGPVVVADLTNTNDDTGTYSGTVNWGDGSQPVTATVAINGTTGTASAPSHTFVKAGAFTVTTTVSNTDGTTDVVPEPVTVSGPTITQVLEDHDQAGQDADHRRLGERDST